MSADHEVATPAPDAATTAAERDAWMAKGARTDTAPFPQCQPLQFLRDLKCLNCLPVGTHVIVKNYVNGPYTGAVIGHDGDHHLIKWDIPDPTGSSVYPALRDELIVTGSQRRPDAQIVYGD